MKSVKCQECMCIQCANLKKSKCAEGIQLCRGCKVATGECSLYQKRKSTNQISEGIENVSF
jgi:hypothetical protein